MAMSFCASWLGNMVRKIRMQQEVSSDCWLILSCRLRTVPLCAALPCACEAKETLYAEPRPRAACHSAPAPLAPLIISSSPCKVLSSLGRGTGCQPLGYSRQLGSPASRLQPGSRREHGTGSRKDARYPRRPRMLHDSRVCVCHRLSFRPRCSVAQRSSPYTP